MDGRRSRIKIGGRPRVQSLGLRCNTGGGKATPPSGVAPASLTEQAREQYIKGSSVQ